VLKYPNLKKLNTKSVNYANKGMTLENDIEISNIYYLNNNIACIHKKPTPVQIVKVEYPARNKAKITEAYYRVASTTDYNGVYKSRYIDFDAKECSSATSFSLNNVKEHQLKHLENVHLMGGIAFLIIKFNVYNEHYYVSYSFLKEYINNNKKKSISYNDIKANCHLIKYSLSPRLDYLSVIDQYLS